MVAPKLHGIVSYSHYHRNNGLTSFPDLEDIPLVPQEVQQMRRPQDRGAENVLRRPSKTRAGCNVSVSRRCGAHDGEATERTRPSTAERTVDLWQPHEAVSAEGEDGGDL